jgi:hypothetical protein
MTYLLDLLVLFLGGSIVFYGVGAMLLRLVGWHAEEPFFTIFLRLLTGVVVITTA